MAFCVVRGCKNEGIFTCFECGERVCNNTQKRARENKSTSSVPTTAIFVKGRENTCRAEPLPTSMGSKQSAPRSRSLNHFS